MSRGRPRLPPANTFEQLYTLASPKVYAFIRGHVESADAAQELVSRVFLKAYQHREKTPPGDAAVPWLFRIASNTLIDYWRVERRRARASLPLEEIADVVTADSDPQADYERKTRIADLLRVVAGLADEDRTLVSLKFVARRTNREIALILQLSEGAVSMRLVRALRRLRESLVRMGWP
jgi:RNA polymerase sigma factor (sigma-70 family)